MTLSKEAQDFIDNLYLYLVTTGKTQKDIDEITDELTDHLQEAERNGKNIREITGDSPKAYMESIAEEMDVDKKDLFLLISHVFLSMIAYTLIGRILLLKDDISLIVLMGSLLICGIMLVVYYVCFRYIFSNLLSEKASIVLMASISIVSTGLFFALLYFGNEVQPVLLIDTFLKKILFVSIPLAYLSWFAWSSKTAIVFLPVAMYVPSFITQFLPFNENTQRIISGVLLLIIMLTFALSTFIRTRKIKQS